MTTKTFCDGCDDEIERATDVRRVTFVENVGGATTGRRAPDVSFDLCGYCYRQLKDVHAPRQWSRTKPAPAAA